MRDRTLRMFARKHAGIARLSRAPEVTDHMRRLLLEQGQRIAARVLPRWRVFFGAEGAEGAHGCGIAARTNNRRIIIRREEARPEDGLRAVPRH